jgi:hypothetical protein
MKDEGECHFKENATFTRAGKMERVGTSLNRISKAKQHLVGH